MLMQGGAVKRNDLNLRIEYLGLETEIYQIEPYKFEIYCSNYKGNFEELKNHFNYSIRHAGVNVVLVDRPPTKFLKKIDNIPLSNVVSGFRAACVTQSDLENFVQSKFWNVDISKISIPKTGIEFEILIEVSKETTESQIEEMQKFLLSSDLGTDKITIRIKNDECENLPKGDKVTITNTQDARVKEINDSFNIMNLNLEKELPFTINEADFWFNHAEDIYTGKITRNDLHFFREESLKCFLDFSVFDNIDLRNVLLLYETVYIALPIEGYLEYFLEKQNMSAIELIELVDMGKVVLLLPNLETRYDKNLIMDAYKCNPAAVVGRRGINTLLATYLSETKLQYEKRFPGIYKIASDIYMKGLEQGNTDVQSIARMIAWPITAAAGSFRFLNLNSPMSVSNFGVNNLISPKLGISEEWDKIMFEFTVNSLSTHISAALKSTYFPFQQQNEDGMKYSDAGVYNIMGDFLKLFWYDADNLQYISTLYHQNNEDFLELFECKNIKITKVASLADEYNTQIGFHDILDRLGKMDEKLRKSKIREYNDILFDVAKIKNNNNGGLLKLMLGGASFLPLNYQLSLVLSSLGIVKDQVDGSASIRKHSEMEAIEKCIKNYDGMTTEKQTVEDIYLLDKISQVAILK